MLQGNLSTDGFFNLDWLRSGFYEKDQLYPQVAQELERIGRSQDLILERSEHVLQVFEILIHDEIRDFRNTKDDYYKMELSDLSSIEGICILKNCLERVSPQFESLSARIQKAIFHAESKEEAIGKKPLFIDSLIHNTEALYLQRLAFEGLITGGAVSEYVATYYEETVVAQSDEEQRQFFSWMSACFQAKSGLPSDRFLIELFHRGQDANAFLEKYLLASRKGTVPESLDKNSYSAKSLGSFFRGTEDDYFEIRQAIANVRNSWIPNLLNQDDILIAHEFHFSWATNYRKFLEMIRATYIYDSFDIVGPYDYKLTYTDRQIADEIEKYAPTITVDDEQLDTIRQIFQVNKESYDLRDKQRVLAIPQDRGHASYMQLVKYVVPDLDLVGSQKKEFIEFLNRGKEDSTFERIILAFGRADLSNEQKEQLHVVLNQLVEADIQRSDLIHKSNVEVPKIFDEMPAVIQFAMRRFFIQLSFGERQSILTELDTSTNGLTPQQAIRRFFEVTGGEKIGQFLSTRRDIIPEDYRQELERFQENVAPSGFDEVRSIIETELHGELHTLFAEFNPTPINVGTIGEVFEAYLHSGERVAVKVITPSKRRMISQMLKRLEKVCSDLQQNKERFPGAFNPMSLFREFQRTMRLETSFKSEYQNAQKMRQTLIPGVTIPFYYDDMVTESVLIQSFANGEHIDAVEDENTRNNAVGVLGIQLLSQLLEHGMFHDDLHPGNVRIGTNGIELLDLGRVGTLSESERNLLLPLLMSVYFGDVDAFTKHIETVSIKSSSYDKFGLEQSLQKLVDESREDISLIVSRIFYECGKHGLEINSNYLQALKAVMTFEGTAKQLDPNFNFMKLLWGMAN